MMGGVSTVDVNEIQLPDWPDLFVGPAPEQRIRVRVAKTTHDIAYENETEHSVDVVIRPKRTYADDYKEILS